MTTGKGVTKVHVITMGLATSGPSRGVLKKLKGAGRDSDVRRNVMLLRAVMGWKRKDLAQAVNCNIRQLAGWERGGKVSAVSATKLRELGFLWGKLGKLFQISDVHPWLNTALAEFHGQTPAELIRSGDAHQVLASIYYAESGQPG